MKQARQKISSIFMALLVFLSTTSFMVDKHYCGDMLVDVSLFTHAKTCGMEVQKPSGSSECEITTKSCCSDETLIIKGSDELKTSFNDLGFQQQIFIASFCYTYIDLFEGLKENIVPFEKYSPPLLVTDILIQDQTFLI